MHLLSRYQAGGRIERWEEWEFQLEQGDFADYQSDIMGFRICSDSLRQILDAVAGPQDVIQWLPVWVTHEAGDRRRYWVLHFPEPPDLLDLARTERSGPSIVRAALDSRKAEMHEVMPSPDGSSYCFVISSRVRATLEKARCTGMLFRVLPAS